MKRRSELVRGKVTVRHVGMEGKAYGRTKTARSPVVISSKILLITECNNEQSRLHLGHLTLSTRSGARIVNRKLIPTDPGPLFPPPFMGRLFHTLPMDRLDWPGVVHILGGRRNDPKIQPSSHLFLAAIKGLADLASLAAVDRSGPGGCGVTSFVRSGGMKPEAPPS